KPLVPSLIFGGMLGALGKDLASLLILDRVVDATGPVHGVERCRCHFRNPVLLGQIHNCCPIEYCIAAVNFSSPNRHDLSSVQGVWTSGLDGVGTPHSGGRRTKARR